jgi:hypothetical protein
LNIDIGMGKLLEIVTQTGQPSGVNTLRKIMAKPSYLLQKVAEAKLARREVMHEDEPLSSSMVLGMRRRWLRLLLASAS